MRIIVCLFLYLLTSVAQADVRPYVSIGAAYKFTESDIKGFFGQQINNEDTAQFEIGLEKEHWSFGVRHVSNWSAGWPVNDEEEYVKNEIFIQYKVYLD